MDFDDVIGDSALDALEEIVEGIEVPEDTYYIHDEDQED